MERGNVIVKNRGECAPGAFVYSCFWLIGELKIEMARPMRGINWSRLLEHAQILISRVRHERVREFIYVLEKQIWSLVDPIYRAREAEDCPDRPLKLKLKRRGLVARVARPLNCTRKKKKTRERWEVSDVMARRGAHVNGPTRHQPRSQQPLGHRAQNTKLMQQHQQKSSNKTNTFITICSNERALFWNRTTNLFSSFLNFFVKGGNYQVVRKGHLDKKKI